MCGIKKGALFQARLLKKFVFADFFTEVLWFSGINRIVELFASVLTNFETIVQGQNQIDRHYLF